jgi:hypothetical protein
VTWLIEPSRRVILLPPTTLLLPSSFLRLPPVNTNHNTDDDNDDDEPPRLLRRSPTPPTPCLAHLGRDHHQVRRRRTLLVPPAPHSLRIPHAASVTPRATTPARAWLRTTTTTPRRSSSLRPRPPTIRYAHSARYSCRARSAHPHPTWRVGHAAYNDASRSAWLRRAQRATSALAPALTDLPRPARLRLEPPALLSSQRARVTAR